MKLGIAFGIFALAVSASSSALADKCFVEGETQTYDDDHPECYFYQGTEAYRAERFDVSREKWGALLALEGIEESTPYLAEVANNNLGYLNFWGLGGAEDAEAAVVHLKRSASMGGEEAHYHLCYVYGYTDSAAHNPKKARLHCLRAQTIYRGRSEPTEADLSSLKDIQALIDYYGFEAE